MTDTKRFTTLVKAVTVGGYTFPAGTEHDVKSASRTRTTILLDVEKSVQGGAGVIEHNLPDSMVAVPFRGEVVLNDVARLIDRAGVGENFTAKVKNIAERIGCTERSVWNYVRSGFPSRNRMLLNAIAKLNTLQ